VVRGAKAWAGAWACFVFSRVRAMKPLHYALEAGSASALRWTGATDCASMYSSSFRLVRVIVRGLGAVGAPAASG
ncbi:MAG: hypothetical protein VX453_07820, partial [Acidobacteriota bacterium]|nr:hypothetical protein [Acidobacteriota bacterium]